MDFFRKYVLHNLGLKLLSLAIAVLLWLAVTRDPAAEVFFNVPIEFHNTPEHLEISSETMPQVQVRVRGPVRLVRELAPTEVHAVIDLANARVGEHTYDLTAKQLHVRDGIEVVQTIPSQIRLSFDTRATREIPVQPRVMGTFASGYHLAKVEASPATVTIVGPSKHVQEVDSAVTDPVDASGVFGKATFSTRAYVADPLVRLADPSPIHVTVQTDKTGKK
jgi:YbbR domain-containing protein